MADFYGLKMGGNVLQAHLHFVKNEGYVTVNGKRYGEGLHHHMHKVMELLWPKLDWHRWFELGIRRICEEEINVIMGPADSGKTNIMAAFVLADWWSHHPDCLWMVSSTELRGSELRIWGAIKHLFNQAREIHPWLPGTVLESKHCITGDDITDDGSVARLLTRGIIFIPCKVGGTFVGMGCFPEGQKVDGPRGPNSIERVRPGQTIYGAFGKAKVKRHSTRIATRLVRVTTQDGRTVDCTPEHPFLTEWGWVKAIDIRPQNKLLSINDSLRDVQKALAWQNLSDSVLFKKMQNEVLGETVQGVRDHFCAVRTASPISQPVVQLALEASPTRNRGENEHLQKSSGLGEIRETRQSQNHVQSEGEKAPELAHEENDSKTSGFTKTRHSFQRKLFNSPSRNNDVGALPESRSQLQDFDREEFQVGTNGANVPDGPCLAGNQTRCGAGRFLSPEQRTAEEGFGAGFICSETRVESVEVLEPSGDPRYDKSQGGYRVHNLEIEGHPSYSVNRILVHNSYVGVKPTDCGRLGHCGDECSMMSRGFLDAYSNWYGKPKFKGLLCGNPTDIDDPLCIAAEPPGGWSSWTDSKKTQEWRSTWYNAWVIAFDGRDSPNFDPPVEAKPRFRYLIGPKKLEAVLRAEKTEDSPIYRSQAVGKPTPGQEKMKVITWQMCDAGHAFDDVIWDGSDRIHIGACDAAYSGIGGDRCVVQHFETGRDVEGTEIFYCHDPAIVPVKISALANVDRPEVQIAKFCKTYFDGIGVPPENFFFDARATMAVEFAKHWSPQVNAVDFGGSATSRPVSQDEFTWEGENEGRRLIRCDEKYSKFVSELWFSARYTILSAQMRGLQKHVAEEGTKRIWHFSKGTPPRMEIETKLEMKRRTKESPDYFDCLVTGLEGARRLGFQISNLRIGQSAPAAPDEWLFRELKKRRDFLKQKELSYH